MQGLISFRRPWGGELSCWKEPKSILPGLAMREFVDVVFERNNILILLIGCDYFLREIFFVFFLMIVYPMPKVEYIRLDK